MKKKELEIFLQNIPDFKKPKPDLEQYITSAGIVADIIFIAFQMGDIKNKNVLDLGCGTGIFSVGAHIAGAKKVIGIDLDEEAIITAKKFAEEYYRQEPKDWFNHALRQNKKTNGGKCDIAKRKGFSALLNNFSPVDQYGLVGI